MSLAQLRKLLIEFNTMRQRKGVSYAQQVTFVLFLYARRNAGSDEGSPTFKQAMDTARREADRLYLNDGESWLTRDLQDTLPL